MKHKLFMTGICSAASVLASLIITYAFSLSLSYSPEIVWQSLNIAFIVSLCVSFPICFYLINQKQKVASLLEQVETMNEELTTLAATDYLTGIMNRRHFTQSLEIARKAGEEGVLVIMDVDHFKLINDRFGHATGDDVLKAIGALLGVTANENTLVSRIGGEEFAIFLRGADLNLAQHHCDRLREQLTNLAPSMSPLVKSVTVSIGLAVMNANTSSISTLFRRADQAMYQAKHNGRDRICISGENDGENDGKDNDGGNDGSNENPLSPPAKLTA